MPMALIVMIILLCLLMVTAHRAHAVIQIQQGATTHDITLARPYKYLKDFKKELMGRNEYHNLCFSKITAEELGHLPDDLYMELNSVQVRQILDRYKEELAKGVNPISFNNALQQLFASKGAKRSKQVNLLETDDIDAIGFNPSFIPMSLLDKRLFSYLIKRWSTSKLSALVMKELQSIDLKEMVRNRHCSSMRMKKVFFKNLHSQQTVEHWPGELKKKARDAGVSEYSLNKRLGVSHSRSSSDTKTTSSSQSNSSDTHSSNTTDDRDDGGRAGPSMRRAVNALLGSKKPRRH